MKSYGHMIPKSIIIVVISLGILVLILLALFSLQGCSIINGIEALKYGNSVPPYPPEIADEPCIWHEGGIIYLIDKTGVHEIGREALK